VRYISLGIPLQVKLAALPGNASKHSQSGGLQTGVTYHLQALGRKVGNQEGDEIQSGAGYRLTHVCGNIDVPKVNLLSGLTDQMGSCQWGMVEVAAVVFGSIEAFEIETLGIDLEATILRALIGNFTVSACPGGRRFSLWICSSTLRRSGLYILMETQCLRV